MKLVEEEAAVGAEVLMKVVEGEEEVGAEGLMKVVEGEAAGDSAWASQGPTVAEEDEVQRMAMWSKGGIIVTSCNLTVQVRHRLKRE